MNFKVMGGFIPILEATLEVGESVYCEGGAMIYKDHDMEFEASVKGLFGRAASGETVALNLYTGPGTLGMSKSSPGDVRYVTLEGGQKLDVSKAAFLAAENTVNLSIEWVTELLGGGIVNKILVGLSGVGLVLEKIQGPGTVFIHVPGDCVIKYLQPGEKLVMDEKHFLFKDSTVAVTLRKVGEGIFDTLKKGLLGGEGFFLFELEGPGYVGIHSIKSMFIMGRSIPYSRARRLRLI
ncbi:MAG: AIM24 family protein [Candidatus Undinarchaeales archaeon]|nr:AIM24 family protein [Candidatus Undinarchaeales archaeon]MDP7492305.1 AIM24 family protein [Candidatus Undinarchaeales archaeon]